MEEFANWLSNELKPGNVDWNNVGSVIIYAINISAFLIIVASVILFILNFKKIRRFIISTLNELKLVEWLKRSEVARLSLITISLMVIVTLFILLIDQAFLILRNLIILREV